jgi:hypothetical protein
VICVKAVCALSMGLMVSFLVLTLYEYAIESPHFMLQGVTLVGCERMKEQSVIKLMGGGQQYQCLGFGPHGNREEN